MIAPDMATMLGFVFTDAAVEPGVPPARCSPRPTRTTFSCITVDSDTSTSDTVLAFATGKAGNAPLAVVRRSPAPTPSPRRSPISAASSRMLVVRDGEGAQKFDRGRGRGRRERRAARARIALAIANSPLVKTAIAGEDANWGRVVMAVGKAGEPADRDKLSIGFGDDLGRARRPGRRGL